MTTSLLLLLASLTSSAQQSFDWPTLREVLMKHGIEGALVAGIDDAERRITSFEVKSEPRWFAIAYYWHGGELLPPELRIRTLDRGSGTWRQAILDRESLKGGSVIRLARARRWVYVDLHLTPSAGSLVILSEDLKVAHRIAGWSSLLLPDGRVVFENNMVHFAPYHPAAASLFDPATGRDEKVYPFGPKDPPLDAPQNRSIVNITSAGLNRFDIQVIEQDLRWLDTQRTEPVGPERRFTVRCNVSSARPRCARAPSPEAPSP